MPALSDVEWIFVILAVLYFGEALVWVRPGVVAFVSSWGAIGSVRRPRRLTGNENGDLVLASLLPVDVTLLSEPIPLSFSADGVVAFVAAAPLQHDRRLQSGELFSWDQLRAVTAEGRDVKVGERLLCTNRSERSASYLAAKLRELSAFPPEARSEPIETWRAEQFDSARVSKRIRMWEEATVAIRIGATLLSCWLGMGVSLYYGWLPLAPDGLIVAIYLAIFFILWWATALAAILGHRYLYPADRWGRLKQTLYSFLSPAVPLRLADALGRELLEFEHPLAVSAASDSPAHFRNIAQRVIRDAIYPQLPEEPDDLNTAAREIVRASRQANLQHLQRLLAARDVSYDSLLIPPQNANPDALSYCPRCQNDFLLPQSHCDACGSRPTVAYSSSSI